MAKTKTQYRALRKAGLCTSCPKGKERKSEGAKHRCTPCLIRLRKFAKNPVQVARKRKWHTAWVKKNHKHNLAMQRKCRKNAKHKAIEGYGGKCACCGEGEFCFLTIDHKRGDGAAHRLSLKLGKKRMFDSYRFFVWIIRNNFPKFLQVLCYNCNCAKGTKKHCPHFYMKRKTQR